MALFMLFILSMCYYMFRMPQDEYDHQYYEKGLNFDQDFNKEMQVTKDHAQPHVTVNGKTCSISFIAPANGTIRFIRPSSEALDKIMNLTTSGLNQADISTANLVTGRWQVILDWKSGNKTYLYQQEINIP